MYSQNQEEKIITEYFGQVFKGRVLDIGANDGKTFSNSLRLIELGWDAVLVEPATKAYDKMSSMHRNNNKVKCVKAAIGKESGVLVLHDSGSLLGNGDTSLVSTLIPAEKERWKPLNMPWIEEKVEVVDFETFNELFGEGKDFDFISIDAEGLDFEILSQIDLSNVKMVCVEHNGIETDKYFNYCTGFGMKEAYRSGENLIMAK